MYRGAADLLYFCTILHFRYININIYTINLFIDLFTWLIEMKKKNNSRHSVLSSSLILDLSLCSDVQIFVSLLLFIQMFPALIEAVCCLTFVFDPPAAFTDSVSFTARSASQCQSSDLYINQTRLDIVVYGTCTEMNTLY